MPNEVWKDIQGYNGKYKVSDHGNVKSNNKILVAALNSQGRRLVSLYKNGKSKSFHPYHLVLSTFVGDKPKGLVARHKNGNKTDDRLDNLEYGTPKQNTNDRIKHGTMFYGEKVHNSKLSNEDVLYIRSVYKFRCRSYGTVALSKIYGVVPSTISAIMSGQTWSTVQPNEALSQLTRDE